MPGAARSPRRARAASPAPSTRLKGLSAQLVQPGRFHPGAAAPRLGGSAARRLRGRLRPNAAAGGLRPPPAGESGGQSGRGGSGSEAGGGRGGCRRCGGARGCRCRHGGRPGRDPRAGDEGEGGGRAAEPGAGWPWRGARPVWELSRGVAPARGGGSRPERRGPARAAGRRGFGKGSAGAVRGRWQWQGLGSPRGAERPVEVAAVARVRRFEASLRGLRSVRGAVGVAGCGSVEGKRKGKGRAWQREAVGNPSGRKGRT